MEDSGLFMQWAMDTLQHDHLAVAPVDDDCGEATFPSLQALREASQAAEMVQELIGEHAASGTWSSGDGDTTDVGNISGPALSRSSSSSASTNNQLAACWNFTTASLTAQQGRDGTPDTAAAATRGGLPLPELAVCATPPTRRAVMKQSVGSMYAQDHIIAERKRREKINQRFIELSTVIPGLKKMDKATILSDATRYVKELQEKLKALQDSSHDDRRIESWVLVKKPCIAVPDGDSSPSRTSPGTPPAAKKPLPDIEARFLEKSVMVKIHCEDGKGVAVRVLTELEALHLSFIHTNVMTFSAATLIITITAKVVEGFSVTADEIVGRLNSALLLRRRGNNSAEETGNQLQRQHTPGTRRI
ncbi:hypothetical protein BS78_06G104600 [Paspalum vaginatum]|nr:hypothetical protein BS78_06G104600 [Paspalum vaginatum]KAJ1271121.1 hypothetical protein BS78_06G104600 [Paspalum vaginatum]KAJ1271122.1 hypothetical protein BS78_06G104600 [Paspalum vaginatum]